MSRLCLCVCVSACASVWRCPLTPLTAAEQISKDVRNMGMLPRVTTGRKATGGETDVNMEQGQKGSTCDAIHHTE